MSAVPLALLLAVSVTIPAGLDRYLPVPESNPISVEKIGLGRRLFFDRRLSRDGLVSCASCHDPARAFSDNRRVPIGVFGRIGRRNAPALVNRGYGRSFFWDGRAATLEQQVLESLAAPAEMDMTLEEANVRTALTDDAIPRALATFVRTLLSGDTRFDRFLNGEHDALSRLEQQGLETFRGKGRCSACHVGPTLTDEAFHNTGIAWRPAGDERSRGGTFADEGRFAVTGRATDRGAFKTPTLREVARTAPYMHDGSLPTLEAVVEYYDSGLRQNPFLDPELRPLRLLAAEREALIAFLRALSGSP